uniref:Uncharacterized protein n=1 Tax=Pelusios castaneus TaxID=367368 RepID=A0A8C8S6K6_9SAUR
MEAEPSGVVLLTQIVSQPQPSATSAPSGPLRKLYQGEPLALGITQILTGIVQVVFGIILIKMHDLLYIVAMNTGTPIWTGMLYIISGSLSVEAAKNPKISLVKGMLAMNIVSAVSAGVSIIFFSLSLLFQYPNRCYYCEEVSSVHWAIVFGVSMILFAFTILEFCVSISNAAFGCKTVCRDSYSDTSVVIYHNMGLPVSLANEPPKTPPPSQNIQTL